MNYSEYMEKILSSAVSDWMPVTENLVVYKDDLSITIKAQEINHELSKITSPVETWALNHPDKSAYQREYFLYYNETPIYKIFTAVVDGGRAIIPFPRNVDGKWVLSESHYKLGSIISCNDLSRYNEYIERSKIEVR